MERIVIALLIAAFVALLFSRIHFHFSFNLTISRRGDTEHGGSRGSVLASSRSKIRRGKADGAADVPRDVSDAIRSIQPSQDEADLASALLNLGCEKKKALDVARSAMFHGQDFDTRIKWAMQNAA